ncbi:MAG: histidinol dehydrogenase [Anaerofustis sp.]
MIKNKEELTSQLNLISTRSNAKLDQVNQTVSDIISDVKAMKDAALIEYAKKFDHAELTSLRVTEEEIESAYKSCGEDFISILEEARKNIIEYHSQQHFADICIDQSGRQLSQKITPLKRVGLYVPGGKSPYPSTVLMDSIPAFVAGVKEIAMITPANTEGKVNPNILTAAKVCGITEIYKSGGAQAIAALAYGTETVKPVLKICGPGNLYVTAAKKQVYGDVDIDMLAGPSEVLIIADRTANPVYAAADLLSQAEHDEAAASILVTDSLRLAKQVKVEVEKQLFSLSKKAIAEVSIAQYGIILVTDSLQHCFEISNEIAPEHLELLVQNPKDYLPLVENAGTVFLGEFTPEPIGDYFAGSNHTIPTSGKAKFYSPLSTYDFMKRTSVVCYDRDALTAVKDKVIAFAETEGLTAHANSIRKRFEA